MIKLSIKIRIRQSKKNEFLRSLYGFKSAIGIIEQSRIEKGCLSYNVRKSKTDSHEFMLESEWDNDEDFEEYFNGKKMSILLGAIDTLCDDKKIKIFNDEKYISTNNN